MGDGCDASRATEQSIPAQQLRRPLNELPSVCLPSPPLQYAEAREAVKAYGDPTCPGTPPIQSTTRINTPRNIR